MQIPKPEKIILVAIKFVGSIGAEPKRAAQKKLRHWTGVAGAEGGSALRGNKNRSGRSDRLEKLDLAFHGWKGLASAGAGIKPAKNGFRSVTAPGNNGIVAMIHKEMQFGGSNATGDGRELRLS